MSYTLVFIILMLLYCAFSQRLDRTVLTAPILFTLAGFLLDFAPARHADPHRRLTLFLTIAEIGLVMTLFTDASRTNLTILRSIRNLPVRLLFSGLLLTVLLGMAAAWLVLPGLSIWEAGALGAILAPTDAGLGLIIVNSPRVPLPVRQALNVEAGLNDGICVPFLMFFIALSLSGAQGAGSVLMRFVGEQLGYGVLLGGAVGIVGGWIFNLAEHRGWVAPPFRRIGLVTLPLLCVAGCEPIGASVFIAAFICGLAVQLTFPDAGKHSVELAEEWGQFFNLAVFLLFGALVARAWPQFAGRHFVYAFLSLTIIRMLPVSIALSGSGLSRATRIFMGWFGPRGLASIVLGLIYLEQQTEAAGAPAVRLAVMATVLLSILAHGLSAMPGIALYERVLRRLPGGAPENQGGVA